LSSSSSRDFFETGALPIGPGLLRAAGCVCVVVGKTLNTKRAYLKDQNHQHYGLF
jgi:hypothetical protein